VSLRHGVFDLTTAVFLFTLPWSHDLKHRRNPNSSNTRCSTSLQCLLHRPYN